MRRRSVLAGRQGAAPVRGRSGARRHVLRTPALAALGLGAILALPGCAATSGAAAAGPDGSSGAVAAGSAPELRLGYLANVTHAAAVVGVDDGLIADELGATALATQVFNAGPAAVEAVFAGAVDATFIGPNPAINAFGQSDGEAVRIIAGATSGGAQLVVRDGIDTPADLVGTTLATPQLGNTQDVALRAWLSENGLQSSVAGGGEVTVAPTANADTLALFRSGDLDGAWVPEPWASRLVLEAGAEVLVDEADLWPQGRFVTTQLMVRTDYLQRYPETVEALLRGHVEAVSWIQDNPEEAKVAVNTGLEALSSEPLSPEVLDRAWEQLEVTIDPVASSLQTSSEDAFVAGTAEEAVDLQGVYDLRLLNGVLAERGMATVSAGGLGDE